MFGTTYRWKEGARIAIDAQAAGEEIETLRRKANGLLTPSQVVAAARDKDSVLHPAFEWNDGEAAERYREDQARGLIRAIVVSVRPTGAERQVRAFVSVTRTLPRQEGELAREAESGYTALSVALKDETLRKQVLDRAWRELEQWRKRYEMYREIGEWFKAAEKARETT